MEFQLHALAADRYAMLFELDDATLATRGVRRVAADTAPGFPCRVGLEDAAVGETLLLLPHLHHDVDTPYRGGGAIYVRRGAVAASPAPGEVPESIRRRVISLRGYDAEGMMRGCDVVDGSEVDVALRRLFDDARIAYVHLHNAKPGCFAARATRA